LSAAFKEALERIELVIASGGLGPTEDDLTRETVAELLGRKLHATKRFSVYIEGPIPDSSARDAGGECAAGRWFRKARDSRKSARSAPGLWMKMRAASSLAARPPRE